MINISETPVHVAGRIGHLKVLQRLIETIQFDPFLEDSCGRTGKSPPHSSLTILMAI